MRPWHQRTVHKLKRDGLTLLFGIALLIFLVLLLLPPHEKAGQYYVPSWK